MSWTKLTMKFKNVWEVHEYHTARYGAPGQSRKKKKKPTPEEMQKRNHYNKVRLARWRLLKYFKKNDYYTCLTYKKMERPPDMVTAKDQFSKFIRKVRAEYRKRGYELYWIRNIEVGTKGAWHIHICINRIPDTDIILSELWNYGKVDNQLMYEEGGFRKLAEYITKTPKTDAALKETSYSTSKNMPLHEPEKVVYGHWKTWKRFKEPIGHEVTDKDYHVRIPKGFCLDRESYHEGINMFGFEYRTYTLLRVRGG